MGLLSYQVITRQLDTDAAATPPGQSINIVPIGRAVREVTIRQIAPNSQPVALHFGENSDAWPVYQGEVFSDDAHLLLSEYYNGGIWYSLPAGSAPPAGALLVISIVWAG